MRWHMAAKGSQVAAEDPSLQPITREIETIKARIRARVEHAFPIPKNRFGYRKCRYRGLAKNGAQWQVLFALVN